MINPVWLRSFCTLVEFKHFTRTAEQLHMTQSGVSQHIHKLEQYIGQPLLIRQGKSFSLTQTGDRLYAEGKALMLSLDNIEKRLGHNPEFEGIIKLASPGSVGLKLYPQLLALQKKHPKLIIDYRFAPNKDIEQMVAEHKVDIGLMTRISTLSDVSLKCIAKEALLLVTPSDCDDPNWDNLMKLGFIDHPDGAYHAGQLLAANFSEFQHCSQFKHAGFSNQISLILEPVSMGLGFTVLPRYAVSAFHDQQKIRHHHLSNEVNETLYLASHTHKVLSNSVMTVVSEVEKSLRDI